MYEPTLDRIVIKPMDAPTETRGGILLPHSASQELLQCGEVVAVGPGRCNDYGEFIPPNIEIGDKVKYYPPKITVDVGIGHVIDEECIIMVDRGTK